MTAFLLKRGKGVLGSSLASVIGSETGDFADDGIDRIYTHFV
jgi:hypothetical protein